VTTHLCVLQAQKMAQGVAQGMSSAVAEIQQDLQKERRSRGGGSSNADFDEAEVSVRAQTDVVT